MSEKPRDASSKEPRAPEDPRLSYAQILRLQERLRQNLVQLRGDLDSPAVREITRVLEEREGSRVSRPLVRLRKILDEVIDAADDAARDVEAELLRTSQRRTARDGAELPGGLARFVDERASCSGFSFETGHDPERGCVLRWTETLENGEVRARGILHEIPYAWIGD
ncbi:MAG: hypothetical protein WD960_06665 [Gemmatimonadota bacterium]